MASKFWGYLQQVPETSNGMFVFLVNLKGSSSCRTFDAKSGKKLNQQLAPLVRFEVAFEPILRESREIPAPPRARAEDMKYCLPADVLAYLQKSAGLAITSSSKCAANQTTVGRVGMLHGFDKIINKALGFSDVDYKSETAARRVSSSNPQIDGVSLIRSLYDRIERNWDGCRGRSREIWRWRAMPYISGQNISPEKTLEKTIVDQNCGYVNQIPAASGLLQTIEERHICVDLGQKRGKGWFELIELKAGEKADTPLRAAFQILGYGLLYCFARLHRDGLDAPFSTGVLAAKRIDLTVLGPCAIYSGYKLGWVAEAIQTGLTDFCKDKFGPELEIGFSFQTFAREFKWPGTAPGELPRFLKERTTYDWPA